MKKHFIIDSQIHLWDASGICGRHWEAGAKPDIDTPMTARRFLSMMDDAGVARAVISPPGIYGFDPSHALSCAAAHPDRFSVICRWTLDDPDGWSRLPTLLDQQGLLGIRLALTEQNVDRWSIDGQLDRFFSDAALYRIPVMLFTTGDLTAVDRAASCNPELKLVVDHANLVGATGAEIGARVKALNALAHHANLGVKLGALPIRSARKYPYEDIHPPLLQLYDAFGPRRLMWASDHTTTMARDQGSYAENLGLIRDELFQNFDFDDVEWILGRTFSEWFGWFR
ncbi:MAG: amidohydrolase family protein [Sphingobium sp.]